MPVSALLCKRQNGTGLSVAIAARYPSSLRPLGAALQATPCALFPV